MLRLKCVAQSYEWGKLGSESAVARLKARGEGAAVDRAKPYAEYWFGTHPSGHSKVTLVGGEEVLLHDWLLRNPEALGDAAYSHISALPFLLKVLSVAKALSVQAHPDKALAERLHKERPDVYRDDNHKPEMACALTPFLAMCGFRPPAEIAANVRATPELRAMMGEAATAALLAACDHAAAEPAAFTAALKAAYTTFMRQAADVVMSQTTALDFRLAAGKVPADPLHPDCIALRLGSQYANDVGVFSPYLLNVVQLRPGEAIFLPANEPHAYLSGDCVEVMATSDNVVRAGLTPKYKDVDTLCAMLTYKAGAVPVQHGEAVDAHTVTYATPVPEFVLQRIHLPPTAASPAAGEAPAAAAAAGDADYELPAVPSAAIIVVVSGGASASVTLGTIPSAEGSGAPPLSVTWSNPAGEVLPVAKPAGWGSTGSAAAPGAGAGASGSGSSTARGTGPGSARGGAPSGSFLRGTNGPASGSLSARGPPTAGAAPTTPKGGAGGSAATAVVISHRLEEGQVWLQPANATVRIVGDSGGITLFRSHANPAIPAPWAHGGAGASAAGGAGATATATAGAGAGHEGKEA